MSDGSAGKAAQANVRQVRAAAAEDAAELASLLGELGYPVAPNEVAERLKTLGSERGYTAVALHEGRVIGMASVVRYTAVHRRQPIALLTAMVVHSSSRGGGVGRALVEHVEGIAREWGCEAVELTSNDTRSEAHAFYTKLGFVSQSRKFSRRVKPRT